MQLRISIILLFSILVIGLSAKQPISLEGITGGDFSPHPLPTIVSSTDGEYFFKPNKDRTSIIKYAYKTGLPVDTVFNIRTARECPFERFEGFVMSPDEKRLLLYTEREQIYRRSFKANYYYYDIRRNLVKKLTENKGKQLSPVFSRDGRMLTYVYENNLWLVKFDYESESQITHDGQIGSIINGASDWVYEEEFVTTSLVDFSPDNQLIAFVRFDESEVPDYTFQWYKDQIYPSSETFKYPKAGKSNSKVVCQIFDINNKTLRTVKLSQEYEYIPRILFLPNSADLVVMTLNREQNNLSLYKVNPRSLVSQLLLQERNKFYIDESWIRQIMFADNYFLYPSQRDDYAQIYLYDYNGVQKRKLTNDEFDVTALLSLDETSQMLYYQAAPNPIQRAVYRVSLKGNSRPVKLPLHEGYNQAVFSHKGKYFLHTWSNATTPPQSVVRNQLGKELYPLEDNRNLVSTLERTKMPYKEFITVPAADNSTTLHGYLLKPSTFDPSKQYPLLMVQYSGPASQLVLDRYDVDWTYPLVEQGYIVACIDGRGTGARGEYFQKQTYSQLGIQESDDQIAAAKYLGTLSYIDSKRIAIWGWSYGGYTVLMSMGRSKDIFKAGISIAPVTRWEYYDTAYTERFMRTPQQNAEGYKKSDATQYVHNITGKLLLMHGTADDNVHLQNTMDYASAMINANKQFDMFIFPDKNHSIGGAGARYFLYKKIETFLNNNL